MDWIGQNWSNQDGQNGIGQSRSLPVDDPTFIYELVDAVRILFVNAELFFFYHAEFADVRQFGKAHRRVWLLLMACQRYNVEPF